MLCPKCQRVFSNIDELDYQEHQQTVAYLKRSSDEGCYICAHILGQLEDEHGSALHQLRFTAPLLHCQFWNGGPNGGIGLNFRLKEENRKGAVSRWWFRLVPASMDSMKFGFRFSASGDEVVEDLELKVVHERYPDLPSSTESPLAGQLARRWYEDCRDTHPLCMSSSHNFRPPRLIDVSCSPSRLVSGSSLSSSEVRYAALSHCWGPDPSFLVLTQARLTEFMEQGFPDEELPANFKDAICMTRQLGLQYLWIDSLCIQQAGDGSGADWALHVKAMIDIYAQSEVCIATAAADRATARSFRSRHTGHITPIAINIAPTFDHDESVEPHLLIALDHNIRGHRNAPIASRAWCLQERILAPRILTLGPKQLFWECRATAGHNICETFPSGLLVPDGTQPYKRGPFALPDTTAQPTTDTNIPSKAAYIPEYALPTTLYTHWLDLIDTYCECQLSHPATDKFAAFAGLARAMSRVFSRGNYEAPYVAGFFAFELPLGLLWHVRWGAQPQRRPVVVEGGYRAPSWSWASTDALIQSAKAIVFASNEDTVSEQNIIPRPFIVFATLRSYAVSSINSDDAFGPLRSAEIVLSAPMLKCTWDHHVWNGSMGTRYHVPALGFSAWSEGFYFDSLEDYRASDVEVFILPVLGGEGCAIVRGLLVRRMEGLSEGEGREGEVLVGDTGLRKERYMRIGMANIKPVALEFVEKLKNAPTVDVLLL